MAGEWIKIRTGMRTHPKTIAMARVLAQDDRFLSWLEGVTNVTGVTFAPLPLVTRVTLACLIDVWGGVNDVITSTNQVPFLTLADVDDMAGVPGFGAAMAEVGWVTENGSGRGLMFPNFEEYNTPASERKAATGAERTARWRKRQKRGRDGPPSSEGNDLAAFGDERDETVTPVTGNRAEKIRGEAGGNYLPALGDGVTANRAYQHFATAIRVLYPEGRRGRTGKGTRVIGEALTKIEAGGEADPVAYLTERVRAFAMAVGDAPQREFIPLMPNWIEDEGYMDEPVEWAMVGRRAKEGDGELSDEDWLKRARGQTR